MSKMFNKNRNNRNAIIARDLSSILKQILYLQSKKDFPKKVKESKTKIMEQNIFNDSIKHLQFQIKKAVHSLKNNSNGNLDTRTMENIKNILLGQPKKFKQIVEKLNIQLPESINILNLDYAQANVREFFCNRFNTYKNQLWMSIQKQKQTFKSKLKKKTQDTDDSQDQKQIFGRSMIFINNLFEEKKLKWDQNIQRFCYAKFFKDQSNINVEAEFVQEAQSLQKQEKAVNSSNNSQGLNQFQSYDDQQSQTNQMNSIEKYSILQNSTPILQNEIFFPQNSFNLSNFENDLIYPFDCL